MIITKTPFRMSFFGGGTDMPEYFLRHGGAVISTTIDKYCYCIVRHLPRFFEYRSEFVYSRIERVTDISEIGHPAIREAMSMLDMRDIRLSYEADLPARSGLGTSSSFAVGMLNAFHALKGKYADKKRLADEAIYLERVLCGEAGGWQDQIAAAYGGFNRIDFKPGGFSDAGDCTLGRIPGLYPDPGAAGGIYHGAGALSGAYPGSELGSSYEVRPIIIKPERRKMLNSRLMMFFTGFTRFSSDVQKASLKSAVSDRDELLGKMHTLVDEAEMILTDASADLDDFGRLLDQSWRLKRKTGDGVSTEGIDRIYDKGMEAGALGGKLLGAGGGGFIVFYVEPARQEAVASAMDGLLEIPFEFEDSGSGVIHFEAERYDSR